jgi:hypothetical protein
MGLIAADDVTKHLEPKAAIWLSFAGDIWRRRVDCWVASFAQLGFSPDSGDACAPVGAAGRVANRLAATRSAWCSHRVA